MMNNIWRKIAAFTSFWEHEYINTFYILEMDFFGITLTATVLPF